MIIVKESSSEASEINKKPNNFSLQLSTKLFVVPSKGFLNVELKNVAKKTQQVLITLESALFTIRNYEKELFPIEQLSMILKPSETKSFRVYVKEEFPQPFNFDHIRLASPEGHLTISHCDKEKKSESLESDESNGLMVLGYEKNEKLNWGSYTQKMVLHIETDELKEQKRRYFQEREDFENKKSGKSENEEKKEKRFECCCLIS